MKIEFSGRVLENTPISNFMKIRPVGAELFHADGRTHDEAVAFRSFPDSPKNGRVSRSQRFHYSLARLVVWK